MAILGTRQVAERLGISAYKLSRAIWDGRIEPAPTKGPGGAYVWSEQDIRRAAWRLLRKDLPDVEVEK